MTQNDRHDSADYAVYVSACEPDSRARANLRGLEFCEADLREAGGTFDVAQVRVLLNGISCQTVEKRVHLGKLLAVPGPNNRHLFPTIQFNEDGKVLDGLQAVRDTLGYASPWAVLNFLVNPHDGLGGDRPVDRLRKGDIDSVVGAAVSSGVQGG